MKKRWISIFLIAIVLIGNFAGLSYAESNAEESFFDLEIPIPRWILATTLAEVFNYDESNFVRTPIDFVDVPEDAYYSKAIDWVYCSNIFGGTTSNKFGPELYMTRGMLATVIARAMQADLSAVTNISFADVKENYYYTSSVRYVVANGWMDYTEKDGQKYFDPDGIAKAKDLKEFCNANATGKLPFLSKMDMGEGISYAIDFENSTLFVSGTGTINQLGANKMPVFALYASAVEHVVLDEGITEIGSNALKGVEHLEGVMLPLSMKVIRKDAFDGEIEELYYAGTKEDWGRIEIETPNLMEWSNIKAYYSQNPHKHIFSKEYVYADDATCQKDGTERASCTVTDCAAARIRTKTGSATGHVYTGYAFNNDATRYANGTETGRCIFYSQCMQTHTRTAVGTKLINTSKVFTDLANNGWYLHYIDYAYTNQLFNGITNSTFQPEGTLTRGMFVTVLSRIAGAKVDNNTITIFKDVSKGQWYTGAIAWAYDNGIVNGLSKDTFGWNHNITREQLCTMLARYADFEGIQMRTVGVGPVFTDQNKISSWAVEPVARCVTAGLVVGIKETTHDPLFSQYEYVYFKFNPKDNATRAQAAKILSIFHADYF